MPNWIRCFLETHCINRKVDLSKGQIEVGHAHLSHNGSQIAKAQRKNSCGGLRKQELCFRGKGEKGLGLDLTS